MHQLLRRQIKKFAPFSPDEVPEHWRAFMDAVSEAYTQHDSDRTMIERTLELSSKELNAKTAELARSNSELEHFAYIASHDLQEPLRTVQSYMQLLQRRYGEKLDQDAKEFIGFAVEGATRMRQLIDDLLTYARVSSRSKPLEKTQMDAVLDEVLRSLSVRVQEKHATIERSPLPEVMADRRQLSQLLQNLVANALKFHKKDENPIVRIAATREGDEWVVRISDNGIGLAPEYKEKIFVIFQRLHSRDEYEGTGVGLAVCKKIVERHGGRIWVESEVGQGATFVFTLQPTDVAQEGEKGDAT